MSATKGFKVELGTKVGMVDGPGFSAAGPRVRGEVVRLEPVLAGSPIAWVRWEDGTEEGVSLRSFRHPTELGIGIYAYPKEEPVVELLDVGGAAWAAAALGRPELAPPVPAPAAPKLTHVRVWTGSRTGRFTDMANAGKRGKTCRTVGFSAGHSPSGEVGWFFQETLPKITGEESLDDLLVLLRALKAQDEGFSFHEETIRGVDAPKTLLVAGVDGKWSASADEDGVSLRDLVDRANEPRYITPSSQKNSRAYACAAKVWPKVLAAKTLNEATDALRLAGCELHYFCAVD